MSESPLDILTAPITQHELLQAQSLLEKSQAHAEPKAVPRFVAPQDYTALVHTVVINDQKAKIMVGLSGGQAFEVIITLGGASSEQSTALSTISHLISAGLQHDISLAELMPILHSHETNTLAQIQEEAARWLAATFIS